MKDIPDRWLDLGEFIRQQRETARLSLRKLSSLSGISNPYLSQIERGLRKPSAEILQQIAHGLQLSAETLYVRAGILERDDEDDDLVSRIYSDPHLLPDQRTTLATLYRTFLLANGYDLASTAERGASASSGLAGPPADPADDDADDGTSSGAGEVGYAHR